MAQARLFLPHWAESLAWRIGELLAHQLPQEFADELRGYARETGIRYGELVLLNLLYDLTAFDRSQFCCCQSITA